MARWEALRWQVFRGILGVVGEFLLWWDFFYGEYLLKGIDLEEKFEQVDALSALNMIEYIVADYLTRNSMNEGTDTLVRSKIRSLYSDDDSESKHDSKQQPPQYIEPTEFGYPGLDAPVGEWN